tara:strand:- start:428156 stop:428722 length:567 start_codon:yes stop_codon:yes gene_type:complete
MSTSNVIHVSTKNAAIIKKVLGKFKLIDRNNSRDSLVTMSEERAMACFGPSAALRNAALHCIMDRATTDKVWADIYDHLRNVQPVVDRSMRVFDQFIANSPNSEAVDWAKPVRARLRERLQSGWTPPFTVEVVVQQPKAAKKAVAPVAKTPAKPVKAAKPAAKPKSVHGITTYGRFVPLGEALHAVGT